MGSTAPTFCHLHVHSAYSLLEGAIPLKDLLKLCHDYSMPALALTDTNNMFGALEFASEAVSSGIQPIIGIQLTVAIPPAFSPDGHQASPDDLHQAPLVLLARNEAGYSQLMALTSQSYLDTPEGAVCHVPLDALTPDACDGLIALTGGYFGLISQLLLNNKPQEATQTLEHLIQTFGDRVYIELTRHDLPHEAILEEQLLGLAQQFQVPLVATNNVLFARRKDFKAHDALICIAQGRYVMEEARPHLTPEFYMKSPAEMAALFADLPQAIRNTVTIAQRCHAYPKPIKPLLPLFPTPPGRTEKEELLQQAYEGLEKRLIQSVLKPSMTPDEHDALRTQYQDRLAYELDIIISMGFTGYFLIVSDFIKWAKRHQIPVGPGRGSGAGSVTAWCLDITDMDPIQFHLIFERFLNPERVSMPDFDIDFCQERRDEVITYVQEKYGTDHVAQIITYGKLQARAVLRDVGRVLQIPYGQVDRICKLIPNNPAQPVTLQEALKAEPKLEAERASDETVAELVAISLQLEGLYRHASTHAAGVVIGDRPLQQLVPLYRDPKSTIPVTQFSMKMVEQAGLVKFDFLGLKTLTMIQKASAILQQQGYPDFSISTIPLDDVPTFELLRRVETVGVFQLESTGMSDVVRQLQPERFDELIALVALYRPGPMEDIPRYIACRHGREAVTYMHPSVEPMLKDSFGVMVYQEQVMWIARELAGYSLSEADLLRRAMGKKIKSEMDQQRERFIQGAKDRGIQAAQAVDMFDRIAKFASYAFPKAHAAPYALLSYQTAYLKANHPLAFYAASLTLECHATDKISVLKNDMAKLGFTLLSPDINASQVGFSVEGNAVRYALSALKGAGAAAMEEIVAERTAHGPYTSIWNFAQRLSAKAMNKRQLEALIAGGAFDALHPHRRQLFDNVDSLLAYAASERAQAQSRQTSLFEEDDDGGHPPLPPCEPWHLLEKLDHEYQALGLYLSAHPLDAYNLALPYLHYTTSTAIAEIMQSQSAERTFTMIGVVLGKKEKRSKQGNRFAFVQISDLAGIFEATIFSDGLRDYGHLLEPGKAVYLSVQARWDKANDLCRYSLQQVQTLEAACSSHVKDLTLSISSPEDLASWRSKLESCGTTTGIAVRFQVHCPVDDPLIQEITVLVKLPGGYRLS